MPELIYLDQNHWINLSKARLGQAESKVYAELLTKLRAAVSSGRAVLPISFTHYFEVSQIALARRRADLALTMGELSKHTALTPREVFLHDQFRRSLAQELRVTYAAPPPAITGHGYSHAFGQPVQQWHRITPRVLQAFAANFPKFISRLEEQTGHGWKFVPSGKATTPLSLVDEALDSMAPDPHGTS